MAGDVDSDSKTSGSVLNDGDIKNNDTSDKIFSGDKDEILSDVKG